MSDLTYAQARALIKSDPLTAFAMLLSGNQPDGTVIDTVGPGAGLPAALGANGGLKVEGVAGGTAVPTLTKATAGTATAHRAGITAADVLAAPGTVTCTKLTGVGAATAGTYTVFVVAGNTYGRTTATQGNTTVTTETTNLGVRAAFAAVAGATFYDIYMSTAGAGALFVGRVTETQRASGIIINAVNGTTAGGTANAVDVYLAGTGLAVNAGQLAQNTAHTPEGLTGIDPAGAANLDFNVTFSRTGDSAAGALTVIPYYLGSNAHYWAGDPVTLTFGGASGSYYPLRQTFRAPCRGRTTVVVVAQISGTGAQVDIESVAN